jgi:hypothetical protein
MPLPSFNEVPFGINPGQLYSTIEIAKLTRMSVASFEAWRFRDEGVGPPFIRLGRAIRYAGVDVIAWLRSNRVKTRPQVLFRLKRVPSRLSYTAVTHWMENALSSEKYNCFW